VNALFFLSNLDLIYVKTAYDVEGYVPRQCCQPLGCPKTVHYSSSSSNNVSSSSSSTKSKLPTMISTLNTNNQRLSYASANEFLFNPIRPNVILQNYTYSSVGNEENATAGEKGAPSGIHNDSIKYHSMWTESENYENLAGDENGRESSSSTTNGNSLEYIKYTRDSGYKSELDNQTQSTYYKLMPDDLAKDPDQDLDDLVSLEDDKEMPPEQKQQQNKISNAQEIKAAELKEATDKCLSNMQSRSRLPISIRSNLNLTLIDDPAPPRFPPLAAHFMANEDNSIANEFKRNNTRRSLDSSLASGAYSKSAALYTVSIDLEENYLSAKSNNEILSPVVVENSDPASSSLDNLYPDLDVNKIELDSLRDMPESSEHVRTSRLGQNNNNNNNKLVHQSDSINSEMDEKNIWTVVLRHDARNFQELTVYPGMFVYLLKQFDHLIYVKLISSTTGYANNNGNGHEQRDQQQYGLIPKSCVINLHDFIERSNQAVAPQECQMNFDLYCPTGNNNNNKRRKSQITAL
jgi:hypothetical protein